MIMVLIILLCGAGVVVDVFFFFSSRRRHTRCSRDWSSDVCSSDLLALAGLVQDRFLTAHGDHRPVLPGLRSFSERSMLAMASSLARASSSSRRSREIGRASCRERV